MTDQSIRALQRRMVSDPESTNWTDTRAFDRVGIDILGDYARAMENHEDRLANVSCYTIGESGQVVGVGSPISRKSALRAFIKLYRDKKQPSVTGNLISGALTPHPFSILQGLMEPRR